MEGLIYVCVGGGGILFVNCKYKQALFHSFFYKIIIAFHITPDRLSILKFRRQHKSLKCHSSFKVKYITFNLQSLT